MSYIYTLIYHNSTWKLSTSIHDFIFINQCSKTWAFPNHWVIDHIHANNTIKDLHLKLSVLNNKIEFWSLQSSRAQAVILNPRYLIDLSALSQIWKWITKQDKKVLHVVLDSLIQSIKKSISKLIILRLENPVDLAVHSLICGA